jgi:hypothetical protein
MAWNDYTFTGEGVGMLAVLTLRVCEPWPLVLGDPLLQKVAVTCSLPLLVVVAPPFSQSSHPLPLGPPTRACLRVTIDLASACFLLPPSSTGPGTYASVQCRAKGPRTR